MKREINWDLWGFITVCVLSVLFIFGGNNRFKDSGLVVSHGEETVSAKVVTVINETREDYGDDYEFVYVEFTGEITSGEHKGEVVAMEQFIDPLFLPVPSPVTVGDKIFVVQAQGTADAPWVYMGVNRVSGLSILVVAFALMILLIGGKKGLSTLLSLAVTIGAVFMVYVPSILAGVNVYLSTIVVVIFIICASLILLNGWNQKTLCAVVGNVGGTLVAGCLALFVNSVLAITGIIDEDYIYLMMMETDVTISLRAVVWGGILIGSLGAIMDVSMSISSAMCEIMHQYKDVKSSQLIASGMRIGRDIIGTMTNTLILAYMGSSLAVVLLFTAYNKSMLYVLNLEVILVEIIQAVVGSMGILFAVPLTVWFSTWLLKRNT